MTAAALDIEENGCTKEQNDRFIHRYQGFWVGILLALVVAWEFGAGEAQPDLVDAAPQVSIYTPEQ